MPVNMAENFFSLIPAANQVHIPMDEPRSRIVDFEADGHIVVSPAGADDVTNNRVVVVVGAGSSTTYDVKVVL